MDTGIHLLTITSLSIYNVEMKRKQANIDEGKQEWKNGKSKYSTA
jgi:hypothetical protein